MLKPSGKKKTNRNKVQLGSPDGLDAVRFTCVGDFRVQNAGVNALAAMPSGAYEGMVLSAATDGSAMAWQVLSSSSTQKVGEFVGHEETINAVTVSPGSLLSGAPKVITAGADKSVRVWDIATQQTIVSHERAGCAALTVITLDVFLFGGMISGAILMWHLDTGKCIQTLQGHTRSVNALAVCPGMLFSGSSDCGIRFWTVTPTGCTSRRVLWGHTKAVTSLACMGSKLLFSGSVDHTVGVWDIQSGGLISSLAGHLESVNTVAVVQNKWLLSGSDDRTVRAWRIGTWQCVYTLQGHSGPVGCVIPWRGGILCASRDAVVSIWEPPPSVAEDGDEVVNAATMLKVTSPAEEHEGEDAFEDQGAQDALTHNPRVAESRRRLAQLELESKHGGSPGRVGFDAGGSPLIRSAHGNFNPTDRDLFG